MNELPNFGTTGILFEPASLDLESGAPPLNYNVLHDMTTRYESYILQRPIFYSFVNWLMTGMCC